MLDGGGRLEPHEHEGSDEGWPVGVSSLDAGDQVLGIRPANFAVLYHR